MNLLRLPSALFFASAASFAFGGGDYVAGKIERVSVSGQETAFRFVQTEQRRALANECREVQVLVRPTRVPWYSWLPFASASHSNQEKTAQAVEYLKTAQHEDRSVNFGYMGRGLVATVERCSFVAKGLELFHEGGIDFVLAFHDPV